MLAALAAERPLLVCGEPGSGKSQLARAAAWHLKRVFVSHVIHARSEAQDLQWEYDAVARLGEAQVLAAAPWEHDHARRLDHRRFLIPGPLWWTFDWESAARQVDEHSHRKPKPPAVPGADWIPQDGAVLLIDEIDKAEADLPNSLLETLGNGAFPVPWLDEPVGLCEGVPPPLVVITTNGERELPAAFLRRCLVLRLDLPQEPAELIACLVERGGEHFAGCNERVRTLVAEQLVADRARARDLARPPPGQAEYLDILRALVRARGTDEAAQLALFGRIRRFALEKSARRDG